MAEVLGTMELDLAKVTVLGYRSSVWKSDGKEHTVADLYDPEFGTLEVNLPLGTKTLTKFTLGRPMSDHFGHKHLTLAGE